MEIFQLRAQHTNLVFRREACDTAIEDLQERLRSRPGDPTLTQRLEESVAMRDKLERRAAEARAALNTARSASNLRGVVA